MSEAEPLLDLAQAVSDGTPVDWTREGRRALRDEDRALLRELEIVSGIAEVHRSLELSEPPMAESATIVEGTKRRASSGSGIVGVTWAHLQLLERIAGGGFGEVFRARDTRLDREVALKLLFEDPSGAPLGSQLIDEGSRLARIEHANVVTVHGAERHSGRVGLWMELLRGLTLEQLVSDRGTLGAREACLIGIDLCRALAACHRVGLVHRDVKARNVMRVEGGRTVLMDFGAGISLGDASMAPSIGTPQYMAPEVHAGRSASTRSDLYSLGVLLYFLVTGTHPVAGETREDIRRAHQARRRTLLADARPDLPSPFVQAVERALAWDPDERYESAGQMEQALQSTLGVASIPPRRHARARARGLGLALGLAAAIVLPFVVWLAWSREAAVPGPTGRPVESWLYRDREGGLLDERLASGDTIRSGDRLFLKIRPAAPRHVYVINRDGRGGAYTLFPVRASRLQNPLPGGTMQRLPPAEADPATSFDRWQVDAAGGEETLLVIASTDRLPDLERVLAQLPEPTFGERPRGLGTLARSSETTELFRMLDELQERAVGEDLWIEEFVLRTAEDGSAEPN